MRADLAVFARDFPDLVLTVEIKTDDLQGVALDAAVRQLAQSMWQANCRYGLFVTPTSTFVVRDDFQSVGPQSIRVAHVFPTTTLLGLTPQNLNRSDLYQLLERRLQEWLERLTTSYEDALAEKPEVAKAFFPDIVGAVAGGRIVASAGV